MKFEYLIKYNLSLEGLDLLGSLGWELITIIEGNKFYLKRVINNGR